ncbi:hypothetical protein [Natrialba taiwanensis]|nr:hypothetical protein [Natrialba taiwanensis]
MAPTRVQFIEAAETMSAAAASSVLKSASSSNETVPPRTLRGLLAVLRG